MHNLKHTPIAKQLTEHQNGTFNENDKIAVTISIDPMTIPGVAQANNLTEATTALNTFFGNNVFSSVSVESHIAAHRDTPTDPLWYGIEGINFHYLNDYDDPEITYKGVRDKSGVVVEMTMWERYSEDRAEAGLTCGPGKPFARYMWDNADDVKELIDLARGNE